MSDEEHFHVLGIPWPVGPSDLTVPDFFLRGYLKQSVYMNYPRTKQELKRALRDEIATINRELLRRDFDSSVKCSRPRKVKVKVIPQQAEVAQGVPDRLRPRIFLTFGTTRVVGRQPHGTGCLYPRRNPWYSLSEAESTSGHMVRSWGATENIPSDTTGNRSRDRPTRSTVP